MSNFYFSPVDLVFILIILFFTIRCIIKGFVAEIMSAASIVGGIILGFFFSDYLTILIHKHLGFQWWNKLISFLVIFLLVYIFVKLIQGVFHAIVEKINLERLDRSLGFFLGLFEGVAVVVLLITVIDAQPFFPSDAILGGSIISNYVLSVITLLDVPVPNVLEDIISLFMEKGKGIIYV